MPSGQDPFVGREAELTALADCRAQAVAGVPWLAVIVGEAGIGKTALARHAVASGKDGLQVCMTSAAVAEKDLPYGVVDQLLRRLPRGTPGVRDLMESLSPRAAPLSIGASLLAVLAAVSDQAPLAVVIDDLPHSDDESLHALGFTLRRLWSEAILIIVTARTGEPVDQDPTRSDTGHVDDRAATGEPWDRMLRGAPHVLPLVLRGLAGKHTSALAEAAGITGLSPVAVDRLRQRTSGHPLHLKTLLNEVPATVLKDTSRPLPVPSTLRSVIQWTLQRLPDDARKLLDVLAVLNTETSLAQAGQITDLHDPTSALAPLLDAGLVSWDPHEPSTPVCVHHSLQRDAVYEAINPTRRAALHAAAAAAVGADAAWAHRVAAATSPDPLLIEQLEAEADRQAAEGNHARAATLQLWAADLLPPGDQGHAHHLLSAGTHLLLGRKEHAAKALQHRIERCKPDERRDAILGCLATIGGDFATAEHLLSRANTIAADTATHTLAATGLAVVHLLRFDGPPATRVLRPLIDRLPWGPAAHRARGLLAYAAAYTAGPGAGLEVFTEADLPEKAAHVSHEDSPLLFYRGGLRVMAGQLASATDDFATLLTRQQADSDILVEGAEKYLSGFAHYLTGRWDDALICADQALLVADTDDQPWGLPFGHVVATLVHAHRGHWTLARTHAEACRQGSLLFPEVVSLFSVLAHAVLAQAQGDHSAMLAALDMLENPDKIAPGQRTLYGLLWAPLLVQAATTHPARAHLRQAADALRILDGLTQHAPGLATTTHWLHARLAACNGDRDEALPRFQAALDAPAVPGDDIPLHRAYCHEDLARHLQTTGRQSDHARATHHLQDAVQAFTTLDAAPHAQRAADALSRLRPTRGTPQTKISQTHGRLRPAIHLTEREQHIAHLATQGMTNQEIAHQLYLSPKTIEYHLSHVYTKLDLSNRRQLRAALHGSVQGTV
ncbi:AAA family ATPase [Streptomyces sp. NPDC126514]|uniref:helix-turn-helix transcriptional regulator n=1 Tax=Streptomyces sp. NPDC126514 TaxID=3155210 RepID=UPI00331E3877